MKCRCANHPVMTQTTEGVGTLHACPECGATVYLQDAGYQRFTEEPLRMPGVMRETPKLPDVASIPRPAWVDPRADRMCETTRSGPGCGEPFRSTQPKTLRCPDCSRVKRWPKWKALAIAACDGEEWRDIAFLPNHPSQLPASHPVGAAYRAKQRGISHASDVVMVDALIRRADALAFAAGEQ